MIDNQSTDDQQWIRNLASQHQSVVQAVDDTALLDRVPVQSALIQTAYQYFNRTSDSVLARIGAAEWLLDNYYLVQQAQQQIEQDLPASYYAELPKLDNGMFRNYPRVYALMYEIMCHTQASLEVQHLIDLVAMYQQVTHLTMGEVWALPTMWRFCLLESLAQAIGRLSKLLPNDVDIVPALRFDFVLDDTDLVATVIRGLRTTDDIDWKTFFETVSLVEQILNDDPAQVYASMDFESRNQYRNVVEDLAKASAQDEVSIAQYVVALAQNVFDDQVKPFYVRPSHIETENENEDEWQGLEQPVASHVGYYLRGEGYLALEQGVGYRPQGTIRLQRWVYNHPMIVYMGTISLLALIVCVFFAIYAVQTSRLPLLWIVTPFFVLIPVLSAIVHLVNWVVTHITPPHVLPKLDFQEGIPASCRTMVVVPALLSNTGTVQALLSQIEQHYLRNVDAQLSFALLTDFVDAPQETMPADDALLTTIIEGVKALNQRYPTEPFYLFHRPRLWNVSEGIWMGWERKRGKLHEFNQLLLNGKDDTYSVTVGDLGKLHRVRYVITLDADTILPYDSAQRLIGTLAHPLNRAQFDADNNVISGYTVLQPRIEIMPVSVNATHFARLFGGTKGVDLYTLAVSDVYQDLFGEGIYAGKGVYDVRAFERSLAGCIPDNSLLSHDLFEGIHGRSALATDVLLYEDFPPSYLAYARRSERWIRGDWQLLPWLFSRHPCSDEQPNKVLTFLDRWKIIDNLRRSLLAPSLWLFFVIGWLWLPGSPRVWTALGLGVSAILFLMEVADAAVRSVRTSAPQVFTRTLKDYVSRWLLWLSVLPHAAWRALQAIIVTLIRLILTRQNLLQWVTAATTTTLVGKNLSLQGVMLQMWGLPVSALIVSALISWINPEAFLPASPLLVLWVLAPVFVARTSRSIPQSDRQLSKVQMKQLRLLARHTWLYFEHFVGPEDHWLPPDHYQEAPRDIVAHRTSPTNIGLYLLSLQTAYDLGYLDALAMSLRLRFTFDTFAALERYRGHFYNWIDTQTLHPLKPAYISTVDSGNLAASLIALKQACLEVSGQPVLRWARWQGLIDALCVLRDSVMSIDDLPDHTLNKFQQHVMRICQQIEAVRYDQANWMHVLHTLWTDDKPALDQHLLDVVNAGAGAIAPETIEDLLTYIRVINNHIETMQLEFNTLFPWLSAQQQMPPLFTDVDVPPSLRDAWHTLQQTVRFDMTFAEAVRIYPVIEEQLQALQNTLTVDKFTDNQQDEPAIAQATEWCELLLMKVVTAQAEIVSMLTTYDTIAQQAHTLVDDMDFAFLFDPKRQIFHIGFNLDSNQLDRNAYDLLASEARLASLVAIAKRDVPQSHWLHLARPLARLDGESVLLSWSGTMFEYLMPSLLTRNYAETLLTQSCYAVVDIQIDYGQRHDMAWGISESGYYAFDQNMNHQYQAFGVPELGFKRGLADNLVMAPYASLLALPFRPAAVMKNFSHLRSLHALSRYGLYEAIDYTRLRLSPGEKLAVLHSHMTHHQGMIMVALLNYLDGEKMVNRFHADPWIQSVELLLQEQIPSDPQIQLTREAHSAAQTQTSDLTIYPWQVAVDTPAPRVHYLANGRYRTLITNAGSGYSQWRDMALTRWRADTTLDDWGYWIYAQDMDSGHVWSAGTQPKGQDTARQEIRFYPHMVEFLRHDHEIVLDMQITVATDENVEIRWINLANESDQPRRLRLMSYGEVALAPPDSDRRHQAFAKLFVESEYVEDYNALLFRRRPRAADDTTVFLLHMLQINSDAELSRRYETDRARFIGRNHSVHCPVALSGYGNLTQTVGATLDPVMVLAQDVYLEPYASYQVACITMAGSKRTPLLRRARQYCNWSTIEHAFSQSEMQARREMQELDLTVDDLAAMQKVLSLLIYPQSARRTSASVIANNQLGQSALWRLGISGDYPMLLIQIEDEEQDTLLNQSLRAHTYWRRHGFAVDLIILNQQMSSYGQPVDEYINRLVQTTRNESWLNKRGGIFVLRRDQISDEEYILLQTVARAIFAVEDGDFMQQMYRIEDKPVRLPYFPATVDAATLTEATPPLKRPDDLLFDNGWGGFSPDGREYVIYLKAGDRTPAPWVNVVANPQFGFLVSESGLGSTWAINSGENRLTTWSNDPVHDRPAEVVYLRDEETADVWSPTPQPAPTNAPYLIQHGAGYTIFTHHSHGLKQRLRVFAAPESPVKIVQVRVENCWQRPRRITVTYYAEWVLGTDRETTQQYLVPVYRLEDHALLVHNPYNTEFSERVAFLAASKQPHGLTADRTEFLGRLGRYCRPAALDRIGLEGRIEAGLDPCAAIQLHLDLPPETSEEVYFLIGQGEDRVATQQLIRQFQNPQRVLDTWQAVHHHWDEILETVVVETPDTALNLLLNRWLLYQSVASRLWGRSAFYQSSGAYGFRDQLQDVLALLHARPDLAREQILRAAQHQFVAGDVLHWWHPPSGRGVRTRISDDLLWLPYVTTRYVAATGDATILEERVPFLQGSPLPPKVDEHYGTYEATSDAYTIYEHCWRAIQSASTGRHGLPLMGSGDWNDGMNRVGIKGKGESIWLGWFLYTVLTDFAALCDETGHVEHASQCRQRAMKLQQALEANGWDGAWYRRAYFDDGTPLGSAENDECRIDAIAQSWSVLSGAAAGQRTEQAMASLLKYLVRWDDRLMLLLTPPFDKTYHDPGYIKGYVPGIRENGGQYTHAALWTIWAFAQLGKGDLAYDLFRLINPIYRADTAEKAQQYRVEPYVIAADVYGVPPHVGRGGWTWYTGSAAWMYRLGIERLLGIQRTASGLHLAPCIPAAWDAYSVIYRQQQTIYRIRIENPDGVNQGIQLVTLDGESLNDAVIPWLDDGEEHRVIVCLGTPDS